MRGFLVLGLILVVAGLVALFTSLGAEDLGFARVALAVLGLALALVGARALVDTRPPRAT